MKKLTNKKGFTLIEMLVVIAIIAILVAIIIPTVTSATTKANAATDAANLRSAKAAITIKVLDGTYKAGDTVSAADAGIPANSKSDGEAFSCTITGATGSTGATVTVTYGSHGIDYYANIAGGSEPSAQPSTNPNP